MERHLFEREGFSVKIDAYFGRDDTAIVEPFKRVSFSPIFLASLNLF
jgi:hypothetical protein